MIIINIFAILLVFIHALRDSQFIKNLTLNNEALKKVYNRRWHKTNSLEIILIAISVSIIYLYPQSCGIKTNLLEVGLIAALFGMYRLLLFNYILNFLMGWASVYYSENSVWDILTNKYVPRGFVNMLLIFLILLINTYFFNAL